MGGEVSPHCKDAGRKLRRRSEDLSVHAGRREEEVENVKAALRIVTILQDWGANSTLKGGRMV